jgi:hypothetical protein
VRKVPGERRLRYSNNISVPDLQSTLIILLLHVGFTSHKTLPLQTTLRKPSHARDSISIVSKARILSPSTPLTERANQSEAYPQIMELDTVMQIVFGIFTISIAVFGIWFAWHTTRGKSIYFSLGLYPAVPTLDPSLMPC